MPIALPQVSIFGRPVAPAEPPNTEPRRWDSGLRTCRCCLTLLFDRIRLKNTIGFFPMFSVARTRIRTRIHRSFDRESLRAMSCAGARDRSCDQRRHQPERLTATTRTRQLIHEARVIDTRTNYFCLRRTRCTNTGKKSINGGHLVFAREKRLQSTVSSARLASRWTASA
jgi:hypothetical protein